MQWPSTPATMQALLLSQNYRACLPGEPPPESGWYAVLTKGTKHPQAWRLTFSHPHRVICQHTMHMVKGMGCEGRAARSDAWVECWPADPATGGPPLVWT